MEENILDTAKSLTDGARTDDYGHAYYDFSCTARMWEALLTRRNNTPVKVLPEDVGIMMSALKLSREMNKHKTDNLVDGAGYLRASQKIHNLREQQPDLPEHFG
jgi:hypothetical protein